MSGSEKCTSMKTVILSTKHFGDHSSINAITRSPELFIYPADISGAGGGVSLMHNALADSFHQGKCFVLTVEELGVIEEGNTFHCDDLL